MLSPLRSLTFRQCQRSSPVIFLVQRSDIHHSSPKYKKKKKNEDFETLFEDEPITLSRKAETLPLRSYKPTPPSTEISNDEELAQTFTRIVEHLTPRLGRPPAIASPIRRSALVQLINLSQTTEELQTVAEMLRLYRESQSHASVVEETGAADAFITRCVRLDVPTVLLDVFKNRPKYGINLTSRRLHRILSYLASKAESQPVESLKSVMLLLPAYQNASMSSSSPSETDPFIKLALTRICMAFPAEQRDEASKAIADLWSDSSIESVSSNYPANEKSRLVTIARSILTKQKSDSKGIELPSDVLHNLENSLKAVP